MDTFDEFITFDARGFCNHCEAYIRRMGDRSYIKDVSEREWDSILQLIKRKGARNEYDCIVGISGGVDSSYTAHLCKGWGLRPLLIHMDNGWNTEISVKNIRTVAEKLDFDYVSFVLDWGEFREIQLAFLRSSIVDLEMPTDIAIPAAIYKTAAKYGIKYIVSGGNFTGEGILPLQMGYHMYKDMRLYRYIVRTYSSVPLKSVPTVGFAKEFYFRFIKSIKTVYPLNYIPYDKDKARDFLIKEYGWEDYGGKHHESKITAFWQSYAMPVKYNMDYRRVTLSSRICAGQITREAALEELNKCPYDKSTIEGNKEFIAKKYGISLEDLEGYIAAPPKTYLDFPNQKKLIELIHRTYFRLFSKTRV